MYVRSILRANGWEVRLIDCVKEREDKGRDGGRAPFVKQRVPNPEPAECVGKHFGRYGLSTEEVRAELSAMPSPDLVLVTAIMTYWYKGTAELVGLVGRPSHPPGSLSEALTHHSATNTQ